MAAALADAGARALSWREQDIQMMMLAADVHLGTKNCEFQMERYVYKRRTDGIYLVNLGKTWEKLQLATRVIVAIENPQGIIVQSARPYGWRAVLKFAQYTAAHVIDVTTTNNDVTTANKHQRVYQPQKPSPEQPRRRMGPRRYPRRRL